MNEALNFWVPEAKEFLKPTGKRHLGRPRRKLKDNITVDIK